MKKTLFILLTVTAVIAFGSISVFAAGYGYDHGYGLKALKCTDSASCGYCGAHADCFYDENGNGICDNYEARTSHIAAPAASETASGAAAGTEASSASAAVSGAAGTAQTGDMPGSGGYGQYGCGYGHHASHHSETHSGYGYGHHGYGCR